MDDERIDDRIERFVDGDYGRVVGAVALVCGDRARAEDAVQEALAKAWLSRSTIQSLTPWVTRVALNEVRSRFRRLGAERRAYDRLTAQVVDGGSVADDPEALFDQRLLHALVGLSPGQRSVVVLHYLLDQSVDDVARTLGVHSGTVKTSLHRARAALRQALEPEEVSHG
jgi:RNA polymerase sigma factor (sigma-70 family)